MLLHEKYSHLDRIEDLLPLSIQVARYKIASALRKSYRRGEHAQISVEDVPLSDPAANPGVEFERREMLARLKAALDVMEERCRALFRLKLQGKTFGEIQEAMGVRSINTIYTWDLRCRRRLLEQMGGSWEGRS